MNQINNYKKFPGGLRAALNILDNIELKLGEAAGPCAVVEILIRLIGELNGIERYRKMKLELLIEIIGSRGLFNDYEQAQVEKFRKVRNKLIHGDYLGLIKELGIKLTKNRAKLKCEDGVLEAAISADHNGVFEKTRRLAKEVQSILEKILLNEKNR